MTHSELIWQGVTALVTILTIVAGYLKTKRDRQHQHAETTTKLNNVQTVVNGQQEKLTARVDQLTTELSKAGVEIPPAPSEAG